MTSELRVEHDHAGRVTAQVHAAAGSAVADGAEHLLTTSNLTVPHDEGTLERSGTVDVDGTRAAVSYDGPYAVRQHEELDYQHPGKGRAKWLELTAAEQEAAIRAYLAAQLREVT